MKDNAVFTLDLTDDDLRHFQAVLDHDSDDFLELAQAAELDPKVDFRFANLTNIDFGAADLRGFDFTGADLRGARGNPKWDDTTILADADVGDSVFDVDGPQTSEIPRELALPDKFVKQHWPNLIMWMDQLRANPERYREDAEKLLFVFLRSEDTLVRRTALRYLADYLAPDVIMGLIKELVFERGDKGLIVPAFELLSDYYPQQPRPVRKFVSSLLNGNWAAEAADFLLKHLRGERKAIRSLVEFMSRHPEAVVRRRFIGSLAAELGQGTAIVVRDPLTGDVFDFGTAINLEIVDLITRAITRRRRDESEKLGPPVYTEAFSAKSVPGIRKQVLDRLVDLTLLGTKYKLPIFSMRIKEEEDRLAARVVVSAPDVVETTLDSPLYSEAAS
jgi:hypothetical protein